MNNKDYKPATINPNKDIYTIYICPCCGESTYFDKRMDLIEITCGHCKIKSTKSKKILDMNN